MADIDVEKCKITKYPANVLAKTARPVEKIDDDIRKLVEKMTDIMIETKGIGLAGPQAGVDLQIFIISLDGSRENVKVFINPEVKPSGTLDVAEEGCLSAPGIYTKIRRYSHCSVTATDLEGNRFTDEAQGLYARCLQHENDHLQGIIILNKMSTTSRIANRKAIKKLEKENA